MANNKDTSAETWELERGSYPWGEWWKGTKAQLQAIGIGVNAAFPGDPGAPKKTTHTVDRRGVKVDIKIESWDTPAGVFFATSAYVNRQNEKDVKHSFAPGVSIVRHYYGADEYSGTGAALVACGLIHEHELPGAIGGGKIQCTYGPDGAPRPKGQSIAMQPGAKTVVRRGADSFSISIRVSAEENERRRRDEDVKDSQRGAENLEGKREREALTVTVDLLRRVGGPRVQSALCVHAKEIAHDRN